MERTALSVSSSAKRQSPWQRPTGIGMVTQGLANALHPDRVMFLDPVATCHPNSLAIPNTLSSDFGRQGHLPDRCGRNINCPVSSTNRRLFLPLTLTGSPHSAWGTLHRAGPRPDSPAASPGWSPFWPTTWPTSLSRFIQPSGCSATWRPQPGRSTVGCGFPAASWL